MNFITNIATCMEASPHAMQISLLLSIKIHTHFAHLEDQRNHLGHPQHMLGSITCYRQHQKDMQES